MIKKFGSIAEVVSKLGDRAKPETDCQVCKARRVTCYPLLSLLACAPCIVIQTGGQN